MAGEALVPAFVLHRRRHGEAGLLLELFTESEGRLAAVARGAASPASRRRGLLQPFVPLLAQWQGRGAVKTLARTEMAGTSCSLSGAALFSGFYVNELVMRLLPRQDPAPGLFAHYRHALEGLVEGSDLDRTLRRFELRLLDELGYAPDLRRDAQGRPVSDQAHYRYAHETGFLQTAEAAEGSCPGSVLLALADDQPLAGAQKRQARQLMRTILSLHLGGRPLKSRELFRTMLPGSLSPREAP